MAEKSLTHVHRTFKFRLKDKSAAARLQAQAAACNQVWNYCNAYQRDIEARYRAGAMKRKWPTHFNLTYLTKGVSKEIGISAQTIGEVCAKFVKNRDYVRHSLKFRTSIGPRKSLGWIPFCGQGRRIEGNSVIYYGRRYRWFGNKRRPLPENAKGGAFVEDALGRWWVCFHVEIAGTKTSAVAQIGIDLGLKAFAALSDGRKVEAPRHYRVLQASLASAQRAGNKRQVRRIHTKIANCRKDFLHKLSTAMVREHALIAVGNVSSSKLARTKVAKSVLDAGWSAFRSQLRYKSQQAGVAYLEVDESFSSVTCSSCNARSGPQGQKGLRIREWICSECGAVHDRDVNAAKNILARSTPRRGDESRLAA